MEELLKRAQKACEQAEIYTIHSQNCEVAYENGKVTKIEQSLQFGT